MKKIIFLFSLLLALCINSEINANEGVNQVDATEISRTIDLGEISSPHTFTVYIDQTKEILLGTAAAIQRVSTNTHGVITFKITSISDYQYGYEKFHYEIYTSDKNGKYEGIAVVGTFKY